MDAHPGMCAHRTSAPSPEEHAGQEETEAPEGEAEMTRYYFSNCSDPQSERLTASSVGQNLGQVGNS